MGFLVAVGLLYAIYKIIVAIDNSKTRQDSIRRGHDFYVDRESKIRDVTTNRKCYIDPRTGEKKFY